VASMTSGRRTVRVFISSTFRDMQAERDHLVRFVVPRLRAAGRSDLATADGIEEARRRPA